MNAGKPKWVACYANMEHMDGRSHKSPWAEAIFGEGEEPVTRQEFMERLESIPYAMAMGPMKSVPADEAPTPEALDEFWALLKQAGGGDEEVISPQEMAAALQSLTGEEHGAMWKHFKALAAV